MSLRLQAGDKWVQAIADPPIGKIVLQHHNANGVDCCKFSRLTAVRGGACTLRRRGGMSPIVRLRKGSKHMFAVSYGLAGNVTDPAVAC